MRAPRAMMMMALALSVSSGYIELPGRWLGDDANLAAGSQPSSAGRRYLALDTDFSLDGFISDAIMLQICDARADCDMIYQHPVHTSHGGPDSLVEFLKRDINATAFVHPSRCPGHRQSQTVTSLKGGVYKACAGSWDYPTTISKLQEQSQSQCQTACEVNPNCTMFTTVSGSQGANCWLSQFNTWDGGMLYIKVRATHQF